MVITEWGEGISFKMRQQCLHFATSTGEAIGNVAGCYRLKVVMISGVVIVYDMVSSCMHCTEVPCPLQLASVLETNACGCKISMDTAVRVLRVSLGLIPCAIRFLLI